MAIIKSSSNSHSTSLLVSDQVPDFVRSDHPNFITFIEKYYEFLANNTLMQTPDGNDYYFGADYASKAMVDIHDIDTTDLDKFIESFRQQYASSFPQVVYSKEDTRILYKNLIDFYRAVGTEDSFRMLFRLLYNEEIEIYYPKTDMLIASGGNFSKQVRIKVNYVDGLHGIENKKIIGATSGASGTVEKVEALSHTSLNFVSGQIAKTTSAYSSRSEKGDVYDPARILEGGGSQSAFVYLTSQEGRFELFESVYVDDTTSSVANTIILPIESRSLLFEDFNYSNVNAVISINDGLHHRSANSTNPPWGVANIDYANTGVWHTTGLGEGDIKLVSNVVSGKVVLQVGNNTITSSSATKDLRHFVFGRSIPITSENNIYRLSIRARDLGGKSAYDFEEGNRFSAGIACVRHDLQKLSASAYADSWDDPLWFASHKQSIDDKFFTYTAYFGGRQKSHSSSGIYTSSKYGNGGRIDLPLTGSRSYNSIYKAINRETLLPFNTTWIRPTFMLNEPGGSATNSQGITQVDYVSLDQITTMQSQYDSMSGVYENESSLLSTKGAHLQDGHYRQIYAYDIRSKQDLDTYSTVVKDSVHPAGTKMFGTRIYESSETTTSATRVETNENDNFLPDQFNSLAGWWSADTICLDNIQSFRRFDDSASSNGIIGTTKNRMPVGASAFEDSAAVYDDSSMRFTGYQAERTSDYTALSGQLPPSGGSSSIKFTDDQNPGFSSPILWFGDFDIATPYGRGETFIYDYNIILEPKKKWLVSAYATTSNLVSDVSGVNSFKFGLFAANNTGAAREYNDNYVEDFSTENTWKRMSSMIDLSTAEETRFALGLSFPKRNLNTNNPGHTGNAVYYFDGIMIEEYDESVHGSQTVVGSQITVPATPSAYVRPGINAANIYSWYDKSPNKHHVYANTHGGRLWHPQYVANAFNSNPAIRFRTINAEWPGEEFPTNTYIYGSIGGTIDASRVHSGLDDEPVPTTTLQAITNVGDPSLPRPVSNSWTIMVVGKMNMNHDGDHYKNHQKVGGGVSPFPTPFNFGFEGNRYGPSGLPSSGTMKPNLAGGTVGVSLTHTGGSPEIHSALTTNSTAMSRLKSPQLLATGGLPSSKWAVNNYFMFGVSENATIWSGEDLINYHHNGRRFANSEMQAMAPASTGDETLYNTEHDGFVWDAQKNYRTSIGGWAPSNSVFTSTPGLYEVSGYFPIEGSHQWDGDLSEIILFNEKLSNTDIAKVEGYIAHKYGLQESLTHKDSATNTSTFKKWNFSLEQSSQLGWRFYNDIDGLNFTDITYGVGSGGFILITGPPRNSNSAMDISTHINGDAYDKFTISYNRTSDGSGGTKVNYYELSWRNDESTTLYSKQVPSPGAAGFQTQEIDLSSEPQWKGKTITYLKFVLSSASSGQEVHLITDMSMTGDNHPHPYRYSPPPAVGANTFSVDY